MGVTMAFQIELGHTLPLFDPSLLVVPERMVPNKRPRVSRKRDDELLNALSIPLFDIHGDPTPEAVILDDEFDAAAVYDTEDIGDERVVWSQEGILDLHSVLLQESLTALRGTGNSKQKREILEWIFEPEFQGHTTDQYGRVVPIYSDQVPFTFVFCCKLEGMDPETIRSFIRNRLPEQARHFYF